MSAIGTRGIGKGQTNETEDVRAAAAPTTCVKSQARMETINMIAEMP